MPAPGSFISNFTNGTITFKDGTGTPLTLTLSLDEGNFSVSGLADRLREVAAYETRGALRGLSLTTRTYPSISFSSLISEWTDATTGTLMDLILGTTGSAFAARIGTLGATHPVVTLDCTFAFTSFDGTSHDLTFHDVYVTADASEGDPNTLSFSGTVYGEIDGDLSMDG